MSSRNMLPGHAPAAAASRDADAEFVTMHVGGQQFGLDIGDVHEVFSTSQITHVPLAPPGITGLLNLRGRIVTAICLRTLLGIAGNPVQKDRMAIGVEVDGEPYALLVDSIGDVLRFPKAALEPNPIHLGAAWQAIACGVYRLESGIVVILGLHQTIGNNKLAA